MHRFRSSNLYQEQRDLRLRVLSLSSSTSMIVYHSKKCYSNTFSFYLFSPLFVITPHAQSFYSCNIATPRYATGFSPVLLVHFSFSTSFNHSSVFFSDNTTHIILLFWLNWYTQIYYNIFLCFLGISFFHPILQLSIYYFPYSFLWVF